jgi:hypothetical protein
MNILSELGWRGLIHQTTEGVDTLLSTPQTVYLGIDPTASSLHVGHLLALRTLRRFQQAGHRAIVLLGGATATIGDPSGKSEERNLLEFQAILKNITSIKTQIERLIPSATRSLRRSSPDHAGMATSRYDATGDSRQVKCGRADHPTWQALESRPGLAGTSLGRVNRRYRTTLVAMYARTARLTHNLRMLPWSQHSLVTNQ